MSSNSSLMILSAVSSLKKLPEPYYNPHLVRSSLIVASPDATPFSADIFAGKVIELVLPIMVKSPETVTSFLFLGFGLTPVILKDAFGCFATSKKSGLARWPTSFF